MPVGGSTPLASALAVAAVPLSAIVTISFAAKPLPETVTRPPSFAVAGVIVRAALGVGVAVAVAVGVGVAVAVAVGANVVVAMGVGAEVATAAAGGSVAALVMGARVAPLAVRLPTSISAAKAALMR